MTDKFLFGYKLWHTLWHSRQLYDFCVTVIHSAWQKCMMRDSWRVYHSQYAQPPIARCGPAWLTHWRFRVQVITLISKDHRVRSFRVIWIRIGDPRSVWIMVHQKNRWIHDQSVFADHLMHHDPDRSWITDPIPDHPKGTQPKSLCVWLTIQVIRQYQWYVLS